LAVGVPELRESLKNIDILILNSIEANQFMRTLIQLDTELKKTVEKTSKTLNNKHAPQLLKSAIIYQDITFSLHHYFQEILKRGPRIVVVTNGAEGVYVAKDDTIYFHPSIKTKVISTLGAGDSFGSGFVASLIAEKSIEEAMVRGIINASSVISYLDAKTGLLSTKELEKRATELTVKNIVTFPLKK